MKNVKIKSKHFREMLDYLFQLSESGKLSNKDWCYMRDLLKKEGRWKRLARGKSDASHLVDCRHKPDPIQFGNDESDDLLF